MGLEVRLDVAEQLVDPDLARLEMDRLAVAEAEADRRRPAGRLGPFGLELAPVPLDLIQLRLPRALGPRPVAVDGLLQRGGGLGELATVPVDPGQHAVGPLAVRALRPLREFAIELEEIELVRQLEPRVAGGEAGDRLILAQRVDGERAGLVRLALRGLRPGVHRLDAELHPADAGQLRSGLGAAGRVELRGAGEHPPPAFAVVLRVLVPPREVEVDRAAFGIHRRADLRAAAPAIAVALLVVRQLAEVRQTPEVPALVIRRRIVQEDAGELHVEGRQGGAVGFAPGQLAGPGEQLQGAAAIPGGGADVAAPAAVVPPGEFAGDEKPVMLAVGQRLGRHQQEPPVLPVGRDGRVAEIVDLVEPPEWAEAVDRRFQVRADLAGVVGRVEGQGAVGVVSVLVVPLLERPRRVVAPVPPGRDRGQQ